jgi:hypothetical protein
VSNRIKLRRRTPALPPILEEDPAKARRLFHLLVHEDPARINAEVEQLAASDDLAWVSGLVLGALWLSLVEAHSGDQAAAERHVHRALTELSEGD